MGMVPSQRQRGWKWCQRQRGWKCDYDDDDDDDDDGK
jgi:hypothetical protein